MSLYKKMSNFCNKILQYLKFTKTDSYAETIILKMEINFSVVPPNILRETKKLLSQKNNIRFYKEK